MSSVISALLVVVPLGLAGAVSPVMLSEQTVLLAGRDGRRAASRYAVGVMLTALAAVLAVLLVGHSVALPRRPHLDATLDVALGLILLVLGRVVHVLGTRPAAPRQHTPRTGAALPFGAFSMATNVTTLALLVPAAKEIAAADVPVPGRVVLVLVVVGLVSVPAWGPVALTQVFPGPGRRVLTAVDDMIKRYGRRAVVVLLVAGGTFLVVRGIIRLAT